MLIYKICHEAEWDAALAAGRYEGTAKDGQDGFLHFSTHDQLLGTLNKWYAGADDLILVAVDADALGDALKWEASRGGELFPHLYAPLPISALRGFGRIGRDAGGGFVLPPLT